MMRLPVSFPDYPPNSESVAKAASAESLRAIASTTSDSAVLLGLTFLARAGDPVRKEIGELAAKTKPEYAPIVAVLSLMMDSVDKATVSELVQRDPDNALGHYLQGTLHYVSDCESEALLSFRKAAVCAELRSYDSTIGPALFKALDALNLQGRDRLCALTWTASRWFNGIAQPIHWALSELARAVDSATRTELADILLVLAGQLFETNFHNRWFAHRAVEASFRLKAELEENSAKMNGYVAAIQAMTSAMLPLPTLEELEGRSRPTQLMELAQFLPARIHQAFAAADPALLNAGLIPGTNLNPPEWDRATFEQAKVNVTQAAQKLIEVALINLDAVCAAYLNGLPRPEPRNRNRSCASFNTPVDLLMQRRSDLIRAAAMNEQAIRALWKAGENDPVQKNIGRLMEIALGICNYACAHDQAYPESIAMLFEQGYLKPPLEAKSLLTGLPYVYVAAGEKCPTKSNDRASFVLLYDDEANANGGYSCATALGGGGVILAHELKQQLKRRGK